MPLSEETPYIAVKNFSSRSAGSIASPIFKMMALLLLLMTLPPQFPDQNLKYAADFGV